MKTLKDKITLLPVFLLAFLPLFFLVKGVSSNVRYENEPDLSLTATPTSAYEVSYCPGSDDHAQIEFVPDHISIPNASIDLGVASVPLENGTWKVNTGVANYAEGTSLVTTAGGNVGIFAHNRNNGFLGIQDIVEGSSIEVYGGNYQATYRVEKTAIANPDQVDVFYATEDSTLTLVTCDGTFSEKRYILSAKLVSIKEKCN
jgi:LPXTG-site transpeptidase (sortase) family protein